MTEHVAAVVDGIPLSVNEIDIREAQLRDGRLASALPRPGTSEGRQLRRWLTQLLAAERVVATEVAVRGLDVGSAPAEDEVLPDTAARLDIGSVAASLLESAVARALFADVTAAVDVSAAQVAEYHARNPMRFATGSSTTGGWRARDTRAPSLDEVRPAIVTQLRAAARRRAFRLWLDQRCAALVKLAPGYEHPGDPRQPDNTHKH